MNAPRPTGVRIIKADGREIPCELAYLGLEDGCHEWEVATEFNPSQGDSIRVAVLPAMTGISFPTSDDEPYLCLVTEVDEL